jgi:predicted transcriptional regulator
MGSSNGFHRGIALRRRMRGLTQHDLARLTGIPVSKIVWIETGRADAEPGEVEKIPHVLRARAKKVMEPCA